MLAETIRTLLPTPPAHLDYAWRPLRADDLPAVHRLLAAVSRADGRMPPGSLADLEREFGDPWSTPETDSLVAITPAGEVAALARTFLNPQPEADSRAYLEATLHPAHRELGLEAFILDWLEARGRQRLQAMDGHWPHELRFNVVAGLPGWAAALEGSRFQPVRTAYRMRRDLALPIADSPLPDDLRLTAYRLELDEPLRQAADEAFRDHWSFEPISADDWQRFWVGNSAFRPDLSQVVLAGAEVAGLSLNQVNREGNLIQGVNEGWVAELCVRRPWRKRGVASAMLCQSLRAFREAGLDYAGLTVDSENPTGALRLYEAQGFVVYRQFVVYGKPVAA